MSAPFNPPTKNVAWRTEISLISKVTGDILVNPTIEAADFELFKDGVSDGTLTTTPTLVPASGPLVQIDLSDAEMNADVVVILIRDATTPKQWCDREIVLLPVA